MKPAEHKRTGADGAGAAGGTEADKVTGGAGGSVSGASGWVLELIRFFVFTDAAGSEVDGAGDDPEEASDFEATTTGAGSAVRAAAAAGLFIPLLRASLP